MKGAVQVDFAFFDPKPDDFHGVKVLLQTYLDDKQWDLSGFVDLILVQTTVGTVVKIEDNEDDGLFSVVTALNLGRYKVSGLKFWPFFFTKMKVLIFFFSPLYCSKGQYAIKYIVAHPNMKFARFVW